MLTAYGKPLIPSICLKKTILFSLFYCSLVITEMGKSS